MKRNIKRILTILSVLIVFLVTQLYSATPGPISDFNQEGLEVYLDRADMENDPGRWRAIAELGAREIFADWEQAASLALEEGGSLDDAAAAVTAAIDSETDTRYTQWLLNRFINPDTNAALGIAFDTLNEAQNTYELDLDADGNIRFDSSGDPLLKGRDGYPTDLAAWRNDLKAGADASQASYEASLVSSFETQYPELLAYIGGEEGAGLREEALAYAKRDGQRYRMELEQLFMQAESRFVAMRNSDNFSLRKKSEAETAQAIAEELIAKAKGDLEEGILALKESLDTEASEARASSDIDAEDWLGSFRAVFDKGLATWKEAENAFLANRVSWEEQAGKDLEEGEQAWAIAYDLFTKERETWESTLSAELDRGRAQWRDTHAELDRAIGEAQSELDNERSQREAAFGSQVDSFVDIYAQSASLVRTARENGAYWKTKLDALPATGDEYASDRNKATAEVGYWSGVETTATGEFNDARKGLSDTFEMIMRDSGDAGALRDVIASNDPASMYLDEYQLELLKAYAIKGYWDKQYEIANAVYAYASDHSSNRDTEAEQDANYEAASHAYSDAKDAYDASLRTLEAQGESLAGSKAALVAAQGDLANAREALEKANKAYAAYLALANADTKRYYQNLVSNAYTDLREKQGSRASIMTNYIEAAKFYGYQAKLSESNEKIKYLIEGRLDVTNPAQSVPSLESLRNRAKAIVALGIDNALSTNAEIAEGAAYAARAACFSRLGIPENCAYQGALEALFDEYYAQALIAGSDPGALAYRDYAQARFRLTVDKIKREADEDVKAREDAIRLLSGASISDWYERATGKALGVDEADVESALDADVQNAKKEYFIARINAERAILSNYGKEMGFASEALVAGYGVKAKDGENSLTLSRIAELMATLRGLEGALRGIDDPTSTEASDAIRDYIQTLSESDYQAGHYLSRFVNGYSLCNSSMISDSYLLTREAAEGLRRAQNAQSVFSQFASDSPGAMAAREEKGRMLIARALGTQGEGASDEARRRPYLVSDLFVFVSPIDVVNSAKYKVLTGTERARWMTDIIVAAQEARNYLYAEEYESFANYVSALVRCVAVDSAIAGRGPETSSAEIEKTMREANSLLADDAGVQSDADAMLADTPRRMKLLSTALGKASTVQELVRALDAQGIEAEAIDVAFKAIGFGEALDEAAWAKSLRDGIGELEYSSEVEAAILSRAKELYARNTAVNLSTELGEGSSAEAQRLHVYAYARQYLDSFSGELTSFQAGLLSSMGNASNTERSFALEYAFKTKALAGIDIEEELDSYPERVLSASTKSELRQFATIARSSCGFIAGLGEDLLTYARGQGFVSPGDIARCAQATYSNYMGTGEGWNDDYFLVALEDGRSTYLFLLSNIVGGTSGSSEADWLAEQAREAIEQRDEALKASVETLISTYSYTQAYEASREELEAGTRSYRSYLRASDIGALFNDAVIERASDAADGDKTGRYAEIIDTDWIKNYRLEALNDAYNEYSALGNYFDYSTQNATIKGAINAYSGKFVSLLSGSSGATSVWDASMLYSVDETVATAYSRAQSLWRMNQGQRYSDKETICEYGEALRLLDDGEREGQLQSLKDAYDVAYTAYSVTAKTAYEQSIAEYNNQVFAYQGAYQGTRTAYNAMEDARQAFACQEAINDYAKSGYLNEQASLLSGGSYQDPARALKTAQEKQGRATFVYDSLYALYSNESARTLPVGSALAKAQADYAAAQAKYAALTAFESKVAGKAREKAELMDKAKAAYDAFAIRIVGGSGAAYPSAEWSETGSSMDYYGSLSGSYGFSLDYDKEAFTLKTKRTKEEWDSLGEYFTGVDSDGFPTEGTSFETEYERWLGDFSTFTLAGGSDEAAYTTKIDGLMTKWALASGYIKQKLYDSIGSNTDFAKESSALVGGSLVQGALNGNRFESWALGQDPARNELGSWRTTLLSEGKSALDGMSDEERKLFDFYFALQATGLADDRALTESRQVAFGFMQNGANPRAMNLLIDETNKAVRKHGDSAALALGGAQLNFILAAALSWVPGAAVFHGIIAAGLYTLFGEELHKSIVYSSGLTSDLIPAADTTNPDSVASRVLLGRDNFSDCVRGMGSARVAFLQVKSDYEKIAGTSANPFSTDELIAAIGVSCAQSGVVFDQATQDYIRDSYVPNSGKSAIGAVLASVEDAKAEMLFAKDALGRAGRNARASQDEAIAIYLAAKSAYIDGEGSVTEAQLAELARNAYQNPGYSGYSEASFMYGQSLLLVDADLGDSEHARDLLDTGLAETASLLKQLYSQRLDATVSLRQSEWVLAQNALADREAAWNNATTTILSIGRSSWDESAKALNKAYQTWKLSFIDGYQKKSVQWNAGYQGFIESEVSWVNELSAKASDIGNKDILYQAGESAQAASRTASSLAVGRIAVDSNAAQTALDDILGGSGFSEYLEGMRRQNAGIASAGVRVQRGLSIIGNGKGEIQANALIKKYLDTQGEDFARHSALIVAEQAQESVLMATKAYEKSLKEANDSFVSGLETSFFKAGYSTTGSGYQKRGIVGSTLLATLYNTLSIPKYSYFSYDWNTHVDLSDGTLSALSASEIQAYVQQATDLLAAKAEAVFVDETAEAKAINADGGKRTVFDPTAPKKQNPDFWAGLGESISNAFKWDGVDRTKGADISIVQTMDKGLFGRHLGYVPVFKTAPDLTMTQKMSQSGDKKYYDGEGVLSLGYGEQGWVLGSFIWNSMREGAGYAEMGQASWDVKLWDDRGSFIKAPTMRGIVDMGVSIAAMAVGAGPWASALINLADDAAFAMTDIMGGYKSGTEAMVGFGLKAATSLATTAFGELMNGAMGEASHIIRDDETGCALIDGDGLVGRTDGSGLLGIKGFGGAVARGAWSGLRTFGTSAISGLINGITYSDKDGFGYNTDMFAQSMFGKNAIGSAMGSFVGSTVTDGLGLYDLQDGNENALTSNTFDTKGISSLNNLAGGLASAGINWAISGNAKFNILNMQDIASTFGIDAFAQKDDKGNVIRAKNEDGTDNPNGAVMGYMGAGLLEMNLGSGGFSLGLGMGGTDLSYGHIASAIGGFSDATRVMGAKIDAANGKNENLSTLNSVNFLGYSNKRDQDVSRRIWGGSLKVQYGDIEGGGQYNTENGIITITNELLGGDQGTSAMLAAMMSHEATHADGDRTEKGANDNAMNTYGTICAGFGIGIDPAFAFVMEQIAQDPNAANLNTGAIDNWKLAFTDGRVKLIWDKVSNELTLPDGRKITTNLRDGEKADEMKAAPLARLLYGEGAGDSRSGTIRETFIGSGLSIESGYNRWIAPISSSQYSTPESGFESPREGFEVDITKIFSRDWRTMGNATGSVAAWVDSGAQFNQSYAGARGTDRQEIVYQSDEFFARGNTSGLLSQLGNDIEYKSGASGTAYTDIDWQKTIAAYRNRVSQYNKENATYNGQTGTTNLYNAKYSSFMSKGYDFFVGFTNVVEGQIIYIDSQDFWAKTPGYSSHDDSGKSRHPGTDEAGYKDSNGQVILYSSIATQMFAGCSGMVRQISDPTSTYYANKEAAIKAGMTLDTNGNPTGYWHKEGNQYRRDSGDAYLNFEAGFMFGNYFVSSGATFQIMHLGNLQVNEQTYYSNPSTILGTISNKGNTSGSTGIHIDETVYRNIRNNPSWFDVLFKMPGEQSYNAVGNKFVYYLNLMGIRKLREN